MGYPVSYFAQGRERSLSDHSYLEFDETTGEMTEYLYDVESPYDDTGWYDAGDEPEGENLLDPLNFPHPYPFPQTT